MNILATKTTYTPEDLLTLPEDGKDYELVDGLLVERHMGMRSSYIGGRIGRMLGSHCDEQDAGAVFPADASYQCFPDHPNKVRKPDVSLIRKEKQPAVQMPGGHSRIAPDLAVEVVSPNDVVDDVDEKIMEYLAVGVQLVWVVRPQSRMVEIHRADGTSSILRANQEITGEKVLPGFRCQVGAFFVVPGAASS
jgi:Uma2 family endonuclease